MAISETAANSFRIEEDALGDVQVPSEHLWGAQTQRSHINFAIGVERFRSARWRVEESTCLRSGAG